MRVIFGGRDRVEPGMSAADLVELYAHPAGLEAGTSDGVWWRVNMVTSLDGSGVDASGHSAGLGSEADQRVFHLLRRLCDGVVVGAGTARAEEYGLAEQSVLVVVSGTGSLPETVAAELSESGRTEGALSAASATDRGEASDVVMLATCESADTRQLARSRSLLGDRGVLVCPGERVDPVWLRSALARRGLMRVLAEGGPSSLGEQFAAGVVDELCLTISPMVAGGHGGRIVAGADLGDGLPLTLVSVVEAGGMLLTRWRR